MYFRIAPLDLYSAFDYLPANMKIKTPISKSTMPYQDWEITSEHSFSYKDIRVELKEHMLLIENSRLSRLFDLKHAVPKTVSLKDKCSGAELTAEKCNGDFSFIGMNMPHNPKARTEYHLGKITASVVENSIFDAEHVCVILTIHEDIQGLSFTRKYFLYPDLPYLASQTGIISKVTPLIYWTRRGGLYKKDRYGQDSPESLESCGDSLRLADDLHPAKAVEFAGRTDYTNEHVFEHENPVRMINGNLLFCENNAGDGLFFLQEAPPSEERRDFEEYDFRIDGKNTVFSCCWGINPHEVSPVKELFSYRHVIALYQAGTATSTLKNYLRIRFPQNPEKDYSVTVNPWGVGCFPSLVSEQFLIDEINSSGALGATHYQVDDGWQKGRSLNELMGNNRHMSREFWDISKIHLPNGFDHIAAAAKDAGVELALWMAPSCNCEYRDWREFADIVYGYYSRHNIRMFKIDAVMTRTKESEDNLETMVRHLRERSNGEIFFNFDTTNGQRPGYFLFLQYGNIFLENRYVCHSWGLGYHPENTLRCLWRLTKYIRPQTLQIEIPDFKAIKREFYADKNRLQPDTYPADYWAAIPLFSNPLLWLAPSRLDPEVAEIYRKIIKLHLEYRDKIFAGEIYSIGHEPDGASICGFQSHDVTSDSGFIVFYRENNAKAEAQIQSAVPLIGNLILTPITGSTTASVVKTSGNELSVIMDKNCSFTFYSYTLR